MRILSVTPTYYPELQFGGPPQKIHALCRGLVRRGHDVRVVTFDSKAPHARGRRDVDGVIVEYLPWIGRGLRQCPIAWKPVEAGVRDADVVHLYGIYNSLCPVAARFAKKHSRPFVLEPLGMYPERARHLTVKRIYNYCFTRPMARRCAALVAASQRELADLQPLASSEKLAVRQNGIDVEAFQKHTDPAAFRSQHGLAQGQRLLLFLGRISPIKNLEQLILAFERAGLHDVVLLLAGPVEEARYVTQIRTLIGERKLDDRVRLIGPVFDDQKLAALAAADLFVLPSLNESFGNAAAEAVAAGIPVLLTETCGIAGMIHGRAGLAVPLGVDSLAAGIQLMMDPVRRQSFIQRREDVVRELSWEGPIDEIERLYAKVMSRAVPAS